MPIYRLRGPNNRIYEVEGAEDASPRELQAAAYYQYLADTRPVEDTSGFKAAAKGLYEETKGQASLLAGKLGFKSPEEAMRGYEAAKARSQEVFTPTKDDWTTSPWLKTKELLGGSLPLMAAPLVVGGAAASLPVSAPVAAGLGFLGATAASTGQFTLSNLGRQVEETGDIEKADLGTAFGAALFQAPLDTAAMYILPGIGKLLGRAGARVTEETAQALARQTVKQVAADYVKATGKAMPAEMLTEAAQQAIERYQAGLSIEDPEARQEYLQSIQGAAALTAVLGPFGRAFERGGIKAEGRRLEQARLGEERAAAEAESAKAAEAEAQRRQTPEYLDKLIADFEAAKQGMIDNPKPAKPKKDASPEEELAYEDALAKRKAAMETFIPLKNEYESRLTDITARRQQQAEEEARAKQQQAEEEARQGGQGPFAQMSVPGVAMDQTEAEAPRTVSKTGTVVPRETIQEQTLRERQNALDTAMSDFSNARAAGDTNAVQEAAARIQQLRSQLTEAAPAPTVSPVEQEKQSIFQRMQLQQQRDELNKVVEQFKAQRDAAGITPEQFTAASSRVQAAQQDLIKLDGQIKKLGGAVVPLESLKKQRAALQTKFETTTKVSDRQTLIDKIQKLDEKLALYEKPVDERQAGLDLRPAEPAPAPVATPAPAAKPELKPGEQAQIEGVERVAPAPATAAVEEAPQSAFDIQEEIRKLEMLAQRQDDAAFKETEPEAYQAAVKKAEATRASIPDAQNRLAEAQARESAQETAAFEKEGISAFAAQADIADLEKRLASAQNRFQTAKQEKDSAKAKRAASDIVRLRNQLQIAQRAQPQVNLEQGAAALQAYEQKLNEQLADLMAKGRIAAQDVGRLSRALKSDSPLTREKRLALAKSLGLTLPEEPVQEYKPRYQRKADWLSEGFEREKARRKEARATEEAPKTEQAEEQRKAEAAEEQRKAKEAEAARKAEYLLNAQRLAEQRAEEARTKAEKARRAQDAEKEAAAKKEAEAARAQAEKVAEAARKAKEAEAARKAKEAEEQRKAEEAVVEAEKVAKPKRDSFLYEGKSGFVRDEEAFQRGNLDVDKKPVNAREAELLGQAQANMFAVAAAKEAKESFDASGRFTGKYKYRAVITKYRGGVYMFNDLAEAKAFVDSYGQRTTPKQEKRSRVGKGDRGQTIFENAQGIRSYTLSGFKYVEEPGTSRTNDFKTVEELAAAPQAETDRRQRLSGSERYPEISYASDPISLSAKNKVVAYMNGDITRSELFDYFAGTTLLEGQMAMLMYRMQDDAPTQGELRALVARQSAVSAEKTNTEKQAKEVAKAKTDAKTAMDENPERFEDKNFESDTDTDDDVQLRANTVFFEERPTTPLSKAAANAAENNNIMGLLDELAKSKNPLHRSLSEAIKTLQASLTRQTKISVKDNLVVDGQPTEGNFNASRNRIIMDRGSLNEESVLHELVHSVTHAALTVPIDALPLVQREARLRLEATFSKIQNSSAFAREYGRLDLKEFVAEVLTNSNLRNKLDSFDKTLWQRIVRGLMELIGLNPERLSSKSMEEAFALFGPPQKAGSVTNDAVVMASVMRGVFPGRGAVASDRVNERVVNTVNGLVGRTQSIGDRIMANATGLRLRTKLADNWAPTEALLKRGVEKGKVSEAQALQLRFLMRVTNDVNRQVSLAFTQGVPQLVTREGVKVLEGQNGVNAQQIAKVLGRSKLGNEAFVENLFTNWLAILRAEKEGIGYDRLNYGNDKDGNPRLDATKAAEIKAAVDSDPDTKAAFNEARDLYRQYNKDLLNTYVEAGAMSREKANELLKGDYVPYYRIQNGAVELMLGSRKVTIGNVVDQPQLKELVGSDEKILPLYSSMMQNTSLLLRGAVTNMQTRDVANMVQDMGLGKIIKGEGPRNVYVARFKQKGVDYYLRLDPSAFPDDIPADVFVMGLQGIKTAIPTTVRAMQMPVGLLRKGITRMPVYAFRQLIRDPIHAYLTTGGDFSAVLDTYREFIKSLKAPTQAGEALERAGAVSSMVQTGGIEDQARILRSITSGKYSLARGMAMLDTFAHKADTATRAAVYNNYRKKGFSHLESVLAAAESMNFARRGTSASLHWMGAMIPFFNAQIQGLDAVYRAAFTKDVPFQDRMQITQKLYKRGVMIAGMAVAYALMMQDDEAYKNATPQERAMNWFIYPPGSDEPIRVPIPFELGFVFKALPELAINTAFGDTKARDALGVIRKQLEASVPIGIPSAVKPLVELSANHNFFTDAPIESAREVNLRPQDRFRANTTELAKLLGATTGASPLQIEHLVRGYTGTLGMALMAASNLALRPLTTPEDVSPQDRKLSEMPFIGSLFQPETGRGALDAVYKDIKEYEQAAQSYKDMVKAGRVAEAAEFASKYSAQIALNSTGGSFRQKMGEFAEFKRVIAAMPKMSGEEKQRQIEAVKRLEIQLARNIRDIAKNLE